MRGTVVLAVWIFEWHYQLSIVTENNFVQICFIHDKSRSHLMAESALIGVIVSLMAFSWNLFCYVQWYVDELRLKMRDVLQQKYGTNMNDSYNKYITKTWDTVQQFVSISTVVDTVYLSYPYHLIGCQFSLFCFIIYSSHLLSSLVCSHLFLR